MTLETIKQLGVYGGGIILILMTLIQITPIKLNPWSWLGRIIGRAINGEVLDEVKSLKQDVKNNKADDDDKWASLSRSHILVFGDEIRLGIEHSKERFDQILLDISDYEQYCENHPNYHNDKAPVTIKLIKQKYKECLEKNKFL